jgi:hypothetical protein
MRVRLVRPPGLCLLAAAEAISQISEFEALRKCRGDLSHRFSAESDEYGSSQFVLRDSADSQSLYWSCHVLSAELIAARVASVPVVPGPGCSQMARATVPTKYTPRGSLQKRPMGDGSKPANGAARNLILLSLFLLLRQARFCAPASWAAFQDVSVVEQAVEHGGDGGAVAE